MEILIGAELTVLLHVIITSMESMDHAEPLNQHPNVSSNVILDQTSHMHQIRSKEYQVMQFLMMRLLFNKKSSVMDQSR